MSVRDPFKLTAPTCISFSGGRTSAYLLWRVLQSNDGLPDDSVVAFANTGKEREETLRFVRDCAANWAVLIVWLEFMSRAADGFAVVTFETASREGEPFDRLIDTKQRLPNPVERACTEELKVRTIQRYLDSLGRDDGFETAVGVRVDESPRIARLRANGRSLPLVDAGITKRDVHAHWRAAPFDLALPYEDGHGNCDLCYLKSAGQVVARVLEQPSRAVWWIGGEKRIGATFRKDRPTYAQMHAFALNQRPIDFDADEQAIPCFCGD